MSFETLLQEYLESKRQVPPLPKSEEEKRLPWRKETPSPRAPTLRHPSLLANYLPQPAGRTGLTEPGLCPVTDSDMILSPVAEGTQDEPHATGGGSLGASTGMIQGAITTTPRGLGCVCSVREILMYELSICLFPIWAHHCQWRLPSRFALETEPNLGRHGP